MKISKNVMNMSSFCFVKLCSTIQYLSDSINCHLKVNSFYIYMNIEHLAYSVHSWRRYLASTINQHIHTIYIYWAFSSSLLIFTLAVHSFYIFIIHVICVEYFILETIRLLCVRINSIKIENLFNYIHNVFKS